MTACNSILKYETVAFIIISNDEFEYVNSF